MTTYRQLTDTEIQTLERQLCTAQDWARVSVTEDFTPGHVSCVNFQGDVFLGSLSGTLRTPRGITRHSRLHNATLIDTRVGDNCLIENIHTHIANATIGNGCIISNTGTIQTTLSAHYGLDLEISVKNEAGEGNVILTTRLSAQMAALMLRLSKNREDWRLFSEHAQREAMDYRPAQTTIGDGSAIIGAGELTNINLSPGSRIEGAQRMCDVTLAALPGAPATVGAGAIVEDSILQSGSEVTDGARVYRSLVGEACHVGRGFTAEASLFFANSYMDNGESCAALCGPFSVSHHKSTLLIGGEYSFYNAGSATNFSNHAYKMGPLHHGTLLRGTKTASGSHILWPATIGAFSVCLGKIENHPDTRQLPFSYVIGSAGGTWIVPARNLCTVGTYRDTEKWPGRDMRRPRGRLSLINFNWLSPYTMQYVLEGRQLLTSLLQQQPEGDILTFGGCKMKRRWATEALSLYSLALRMFMWKAFCASFLTGSPDSWTDVYRKLYGDRHAADTGPWTDLCGMLCPEKEAGRLARQLLEVTISDIEAELPKIHFDYRHLAWRWAWHNVIIPYARERGITLPTPAGTEPDATITEPVAAPSAPDATPTVPDTAREEYYAALKKLVKVIKDDGIQAQEEWLRLIRADAGKEFQMGDVDEQTLRKFLEQL